MRISYKATKHTLEAGRLYQLLEACYGVFTPLGAGQKKEVEFLQKGSFFIYTDESAPDLRWSDAKILCNSRHFSVYLMPEHYKLVE